MKVLLTSTSFQDTPGRHQDLLYSQGWEVDTLRGPIFEDELLQIIDKYDAVICGDDDYTRAVIKKGREHKLRSINKYGVGLDRIDLIAAKELDVTVTNCPGVNQVSVSEHVIALLLCFSRNIHLEYNITSKGQWKRYVGNEIEGKTIGIFGLGSVGKELAKKASALGLRVKVCDKYPDHAFIEEHSLELAQDIKALVDGADVISLHSPLNDETRGIFNKDLFENHIKQELILINTARADLVNQDDLIVALDQKLIKGYLTDVMPIEPMDADHPLKNYDNVIITPHIGSRTYESVQRQGSMAVQNLIDLVNT